MRAATQRRAAPLVDVRRATIVDEVSSKDVRSSAALSWPESAQGLASATLPSGDLAASARMADLRAALFDAPVEPVRIDRFVLLDPLGAGGMGVVFAAYDPRLDRRIALKLVRSDAAAPAEQIEARLLREAQAMARLSHPNVVQIHEAGVWQGRIFLAMELIQGTTLTAWLAARRRGWREIVGVFVEAGRGLAAAHAVGIVHRDFKPDNVLVGDDGRARVTDFGLARDAAAPASDGAGRAGAGPEAEPPASHPLGASLTASGALAGTPGYMSPEQFRGQRATAASDQFSFCVALFHALYGVRPFVGDDPLTLARAVLTGELRDPPRSDVPGRIHRALVRGLAPAPADRFPSMESLLAVIAARPPWRPIAAAGALTIAAAALGALVAVPGPCQDARGLLAGAWDPERRAAAERAFAGSSLAAADVLWASTAATLDAYAQAAGDAYTRSCLAHQRGEASSELHDLKVGCLRRRLAVVEAMASELAAGSPERLREGPRAAARLDDLASCDDERALLLGVEPPPLARRAAHQALALALADARARELLGDHIGSAAALDDALLPRARALGHAPTLAEALAQRGRLAVLSRDFSTARATLREALALAIGARHDVLVSELWSWLIQAEVLDRSAAGDAELWLRQADAWLLRGQGTGLLRADLEAARSITLQLAGDVVGAEAASRRALEIREAILGAEHLDVAIARLNHADQIAAAGRTGAAIAELRGALAGITGHVGEEHMLVADALHALSAALLESGDPAALAEAAALERRAGAIIRAVGGARAIELGDTHLTLAQIAYQRGDLAAAEGDLAAALTLYERHPERPDRAHALSFLGVLLHQRGRDDEAIAAHLEARRIFAGGGAADSVAFTDHNLAELLAARGDDDAAIARFQAAIAGLEGALGPDAPALREPLLGLGEALIRRGRPCDALPWLRRVAGDEASGGAPALPLARERCDRERAP